MALWLLSHSHCTTHTLTSWPRPRPVKRRRQKEIFWILCIIKSNKLYYSGNLFRGIVNCLGAAQSVVWSVGRTSTTVSVSFVFFFISTFTTFQLLQIMLAINWFPFRKYFLEKFMYKNCNFKPCVTDKTTYVCKQIEITF